MNIIKYFIDNVNITLNTGDVAVFTTETINIEIYEDLFQPFLSGKIIIHDRFKIFELYPIIGNETLNFTIKENSENEDIIEFKNFKIVSCTETDIESSDQFNTKMHILEFVDEKLLNGLQEYSKSYTNKLCSYIVNDISKNMLLNQLISTNIDTTKGLKSITFPYMTAIDMIKYISNKYSITTNNKYGYIYYTDITQKTYYKSLYNLMNKTESYNLFLTNKFTNNFNIHHISEYNFNMDQKNITNNINNGLFGNTEWYYDISKGSTYSKISNTYTTLKNNTKNLGNYSLYNKDYSYTNNYITTDNNYIMKNKMLFQEFKNNTLTLKQEGSRNKTIGIIAKIIFKPFYQKEGDKYDLKYSGKWFCFRQIHNFSIQGYTILSTFTKNAYEYIKDNKNLLKI